MKIKKGHGTVVVNVIVFENFLIQGTVDELYDWVMAKMRKQFAQLPFKVIVKGLEEENG